MHELDHACRNLDMPVDGKIVRKSLPREGFLLEDPGVEVFVNKAAVEPVWHLPEMASRFCIKEDLLRRCLFEGESRCFVSAQHD